MAQRILVFESDTQFARTLREGFGGRDVDLEVVADGNDGLESAAKKRPDLILLSIELPSMNGFLVCKKIKKHSDLKDIPLIILSSDANADEIFEQHRKLRTRAEDYVRKPVAFDDLLGRVRQFVDVGELAASTAATTVIHQGGGVDEEIEAFAEDAFDALIVDSADQSSPIDPGAFADEATSVVSAEDFEVEASLDIDEAVQLEEDVEVVTPSEPPPKAVPKAVPRPVVPSRPPPPAERAAAPQADPAELRAAQARAEKLESELQAARSELEVAQQEAASANDELEKARTAAAQARSYEEMVAGLEKEVAQLKAKGGGGGISSREFLDLREKLNKKDKEILDLRDQVTSRDKELIDLREKNIALERQNADNSDRLLELEREAETAKEKIAGLESDKDAAAKRFDDTKKRLERAEEKGKKLEEELGATKRAAEVELQGLRGAHADEKHALLEAHEEAVARLKSEHAVAAEKAKDAQAEALDALRAEQRAAMEKAAREAAEAASKARDEHATEMSTLRSSHASELDARAEAAARDKADALQAQKQTLDAEREAAVQSTTEQLTREKEAALATAKEEHSRELALLGRRLADTEGKLASTSEKLTTLEKAKAALDAEHASRGAALDAAHTRIADLETRLERALHKIQTDDALLDRARRAMAIGLILLEDQKNNVLEERPAAEE